jgi:DNA polymerase III delta prime subunit
VDEKQTANNANTGLGFIMLLSGEPGVGKTLTAESGTLTRSDHPLSLCLTKRLLVAEEMRQPLYFMNASELGETATEVEESLGQVLELASKWNAILLLDECDMFLEARSNTDIRRNRLVSGEFASAPFSCKMLLSS